MADTGDVDQSWFSGFKKGFRNYWASETRYSWNITHHITNIFNGGYRLRTTARILDTIIEEVMKKYEVKQDSGTTPTPATDGSES